MLGKPLHHTSPSQPRQNPLTLAIRSKMLEFIKRALRNPTPKLYGLDHAILNHTNNFPEACEALLEQVLTTALSKESKSIKILDVGCGCGDQSLYLLKTLSSQNAKNEEPSHLESQSPNQNLRHRSTNKSLPTLTSYLGITLEPAQAGLAKSRINQSNPSIPAKIFCGNASIPSNWPAELSSLVNTSNDPKDESTWLLALDTLYHFRPSRVPLLAHAVTLQASFMAFDLLIGESVTWWQKLLLRIVCLGTNAPFGNFITEKEYVDMLFAVGYKRENIEVRDVSKFVFGGLADFLAVRKEYGMPMGKFGMARRVFDWWAVTGVVRGAVVVARV
ncbi:unnamed protein product [Penicillium salamii]|uniref:Methyltransferase domain-containing protein n=1 Tax=Penicillium salamii TaxID=1612424 RepID=A0A9W4JD21_9EURO|nr:unnamed protein product [Penicillium salamii]CAG7986498.1 unnamed protein product [Penicillium salamii]CAG8076847.1 unnamed protein product [Penicillium salamii]CAG8248949.1 unnamed protein product [Penicillium salamii]CAG8284544.1 unnamed protein product [Penicillium salamii]